MTIYGYARVSTTGQKLGDQREQLKAVGVTKVYAEKFTGTSTDRPKFNELLAVVKPGDTITVTKLDRLARNTREALAVIEDLLQQDININVLNLGTIENTSVGRMIYTILLSVAELERDMIVERTQAGKAYAKKHNPNYKEGRPKRKLTPRYLEAIKLLETNSYKETARRTELSIATLARIKKQYQEEQGAQQ